METQAITSINKGNVIFLQAYVEKHFWSLVQKGHFRELATAYEAQALETNDEFTEYLPIDVPANDSLNKPPLEISLEDLYDGLDTDLLLTFNPAWGDSELDDPEN